MSKVTTLGHLEFIVLVSLHSFGDETWVGAVQNKVNEITGSDVQYCNVFITLNQLQEKGFVSSYIGPPVRKRGGRGKRWFSMTEAGVAALRDTEKVLKGVLECVS